MSSTAVPPTAISADDPSGRRAARVLAVCQALYTSSVSIDLTLTGLVGYTLADDKALATLPFSLITIAAALTTIFASFLMARIGRRAGFVVGAAVGAAGGAISVYAIIHHSFWAFCAGTATVGVFQAFAQYYRLAAADAVGVHAKSRAISTVLAGGVVAAVLGPALAAWSRDWLAPVAFAGSYALVTVFGLASIVLLALLYRDVALPANVAAAVEPARPLGRIVRQPIFIAALANNALGYAVMMFVMTATPIAALACGHTIGDGAQIIQWHLVGMFAPSFFSARLIHRFGVLRVIGAGIALSAMCGVLALRSTDLPHFYVALACLGVGWNFMFVGGTTLLSQAYQPSERAKTQAASEFTTFAFSALGSLFAGQLLVRFGWQTINAAIFAPLAVAAMATLIFAWSRSRGRVAAASS
ncbi:MFS transporter [Paraburkholderia sp. BL10I2N1]|uniref:MFS transporter n=1 Tax=Paraburkholderia sp. BL10I2N1 TaxID=1938796 RepID=UPI00105BC16A|nr:MFS transporter [Paraburkholderia sp. BL10I2N1]TDN68995.1 putative MFS family arabinose efflux permease [Paraburkholderia sp. BL10I2N1]